MMLNLRQHLFLSVAVPLTVGMLICVLAALVPLYSSINDWNSQTSNAIEAMSLTAAATRFGKMNEDLHGVYKQLVNDLNTIRNNTVMHLNREQPIRQYYTPYYARYAVLDSSPEYEDDSIGGYVTVRSNSGVWLRGTSDYNTFRSQTQYLNESGLVDPLLRALKKTNMKFYVRLMLAFENGLYRFYPWELVPNNYVTGTGYCTSPNHFGSTIGFDPRCRPWYRQAADQNDDRTIVVFSVPYQESTTGRLLTSASTPIFAPGGNTFVGIANIDFDVTDVRQMIFDARIASTSAYLFVMDRSGTIIMHPQVSFFVSAKVGELAVEKKYGASVWSNLIGSKGRAEAWLASGSNELVLRDYTQHSRSTGDIAYILRVDDHFIGVTINSMSNYILVMMLPADFLDREHSAALSDLKSLLEPGTIAICVVLVGLFLILLLGTHIISNYYSRAIKDAALILQQSVKPDLKVQLKMRQPVCAEINALFQQFEPMFIALRFGNASYYDGNLERALEDYKIAEEMMKRTGNKNGLGKVYNNTGNVYMKKNAWSHAEDCYMKSVQIGRELINECEVELKKVNLELDGSGVGDIEVGGAGANGRFNHANGMIVHGQPIPIESNNSNNNHNGMIEVQPKSSTTTSPSSPIDRKKKLVQKRLQLLIQLAKRESNLGVLFNEKGERDLAYRYLNDAISHHQAADDELGTARVSSNVAQFYLDDGRLDEAETLIQATYAKLCNVDGDHVPDPISLQYATQTLGLLCAKKGKFDDAIGWLQYTLQLQDQHESILDASVQQTCFGQLEQIFTQMGNEVMASKYRQLHYGHHHHRAQTLKSVLFALDCSGSMAGSNISRCRVSLKSIIQDHIHPNDRISLITFNSVSRIVFPLVERGVDPRHFHQTVDQSTQTFGQTAFWDALYGGVSEFFRVYQEAEQRGDKIEMNHNNWLISLTDGEDNVSVYTPNQIIRLLQSRPDIRINMIILTVGESYNRDGVSAILGAVKHLNRESHHMKIGSSNISEAFENVAKIITAQLNVETL